MGNIRIELGPNGALIAQVLTKLAAEAARLAGEDLYASHFATCPTAAAFRKK